MSANSTIIDPAELTARQEKVRLAAEAEIAALTAACDIENNRRAPLLNSFEKRRLLAEKIAHVRRGRIVQEGHAAAFRARIDTLFSSDAETATGYFWTHINVNLQETVAERAIIEIDRWLATKTAELADLDRQIIAMAADLRLHHLLPDDISSQGDTPAAVPRS
jgi:hypothetical protein